MFKKRVEMCDGDIAWTNELEHLLIKAIDTLYEIEISCGQDDEWWIKKNVGLW